MNFSYKNPTSKAYNVNNINIVGNIGIIPLLLLLSLQLLLNTLISNLLHIISFVKMTIITLNNVFSECSSFHAFGAILILFEHFKTNF